MKTTLTLLAATLLLFSGTAVAALKPYPMKTCLVTGNKLGSMGTPIAKTYGEQQVKFCCKPCVAKFEKNPERFLAKLR